jgi:maltooligosyltrehalose trehalohydrolase
MRHLPVGAEIVRADAGGGSGAHFRVWAPRRKRVEIVLEDDGVELSEEPGGYFSGRVSSAHPGSRYRVRLDGRDAFPDPASRYQPDGPHGASQVVDPSRFRWTDRDWRGIGIKGQVLYEMHVGTFTPSGTFAAATEHLGGLVDLGITAVELMPVGEFPGRFGWGYDGVNLFAPYHMYGDPDEFRKFVNHAHEIGLGVILDVVYNHFGPDGNYLSEFSDAYVSTRHTTEWGEALNFDGRDSGPVRELVLSNVRHWISEYHLDGLRLDATHSIFDDSETHILLEVGRTAREAAAGRQIVVIAESEPQDARLVRGAEAGGYALDQLWSDDFHHVAVVAAGGKREAYFTDYRGTPQEFVSALKHGPLYQGQHYRWQKKRRGAAAWDLEPHQLVFYLENHDQVANSSDGRRLHQATGAGRYRALAAVLLLAPQTPMLFQGQEFGSSSPFLYFADHHRELAPLVRKGRGEFLAQFPSIADTGVDTLPDPGAPATFERSRLNWEERRAHRAHLALYRDLIALRRCDPVFCGGDARVDGAVLNDHAFIVRFFAGNGDDRLLVVNLGPAFQLDVAPEPLLAPPNPARGWERIWHSEDACYGGGGAPSPESEHGSWRLPAESAALLGASTE